MPRNETPGPPALLALVAMSSPAPRAAAESAFLAQAIGQDGQRRGLRGGAPVLTSARSAYLAAEWRGSEDRRPAPGRLRSDSV